MDKKPVHLLSTCSDPRQQTTVRRWTGEEHASVSCPEVLPLYVKAMRGVRLDVFTDSQRLAQAYSKLGRRSRKWFFSLVWFIVDIAIHNAYILYQNKHQQSHFSQKDFRKALMKQLVGSHTSRKSCKPTLKHQRDSGDPTPFAVLCNSEKRGACSTQCRQRVGQGGSNQRQHWRCEDCQTFMCVPDCYNKHVQALVERAAQCHMVDQ
jgi:hypothetical protein